MNSYTVAAAWIALALVASIVSIRAGVAVALSEILLGAVVGNAPLISQLAQQTEFTTFLASVGSVTLTFLAGAEIDPVSLRRHWKPSLSIGLVSFLLPLLGATAVSYFLLHWPLHAAEIAGVALSTTSVAVVYAVMVETGLNREELGKLILAACFVTDLGTVLALGALFAGFSVLLAVFVAMTVLATIGVAPALRFVSRSFGHRVSEPEIKFLFLVLLGLGGLATAAGSEAVLPAYVVGLAAAGVFHADRVLMDRMRSIAFAFMTPLLLHSRGPPDLGARPDWRSRPDRGPLCRQDGDQARRRVARRGVVRNRPSRPELRDAVDGDGAHLRLDLSPLWLQPWAGHLCAVLGAAHGRDSLRGPPDACRAAAVPAHGRRCRGGGGAGG